MEGVNFILFIFRFLIHAILIANLVLWGLDKVIGRIVNHNSKGHEDDG